MQGLSTDLLSEPSANSGGIFQCTFDFFDHCSSPTYSSEKEVDTLQPYSDHLLSEDIWKKFELDFPELAGIDSIFNELDYVNQNSLVPIIGEDCVMRNHDCMWAGHCASREHPVDEPRHQSLNPIVPKPPVVMIKPPPPPKSQNHQQSVLKPALRPVNNSQNIMQHTPQTPPESDDEENKSKPTTVLQILNQAINECDLEDDSDLCEYFEADSVDVKEESIDIKEEPLDFQEEDMLDVDEEKEEEEEEDEEEEEELNVGNNVIEQKVEYKNFSQLAAQNDHSYHKDKNASMMHHTNYGLDTPSDSEEEEIDVVSVSDKLTNTARMVCSLPTNPSTRDRQQLQRRMATAISKKQVNNGIKTILPVRKSNVEPASQKKRQNESRGVKRSRGYRANGSPYKKRAYGHQWSDSEPEPSEKRSLHNNMERQRRIDLRNAFEDLRVLIPEVAKKDRAAKVVILREAAQYCDFLGNISTNYVKQKEDLKRQQEWLRSRVSQLRRSLAAKR